MYITCLLVFLAAFHTKAQNAIKPGAWDESNSVDCCSDINMRSKHKDIFFPCIYKSMLVSLHIGLY